MVNRVMDATECFHEMENEQVQEMDDWKGEWISGALSEFDTSDACIATVCQPFNPDAAGS